MTATDEENAASDAGDHGDASGHGDAGDHGTATTSAGTTPRELLEELVAIPSPTGEEQACAEHLVAYFEEYGREVYLDEVGNVRAPGDDDLLLTSHVDTVPGDIDVEVAPGEDGDPALWGRGSVDAKGSLAAMAVAAVRTGASFAGVVREEVDSAGARHLVADSDAPGAVINGEPSGWDAVTLGYRGLVSGRYEVSGPAGHSSRPEPNALQAAMAWWTNVEEAFDAVTVTRDVLGPGSGSDPDASVFESVTPKPVEMEGGTTEDGLAVAASIDFQLRVPPTIDLATVQSTVEERTGAGSIAWHDDHAVPPVMESPRTPLARAFRAAIREHGGEPRMLRKSGTADVNIYADAWDCPTITYGPGDSALDHAPNEHLPLTEFDRAVAVLETVAGRITDETP